MGFIDSNSATAGGTGGVGLSVWSSGGTVNGGNAPNNMLFTEIEAIGIELTLGDNAQMGVNHARSSAPDIFYLTKTNAYMLGGTVVEGQGGGMVGGMSPNLPSGTTYFNGLPTWNWWDSGDNVEDNDPTWQLRYGSGVGPGTELTTGWVLAGGSGKHSADHPVGNMSQGGGQYGRWELVNRGQVVAVSAGNHINPCYTNQGTGYTYQGTPATEVNPFSAGSVQSRKWIVNTGDTHTVVVTGTSYNGGGSFAISAVTCIPNGGSYNHATGAYA
tara:strand:+ start:12 stop:827 length:816 start_codon:yes stop_codon:yes gene_type:complete